ncbi:MAG: hypothetical protein ACPG47_09900 [Leucothrix sp.]
MMKCKNNTRSIPAVLSLSFASLLILSFYTTDASANHVVSARYVNAIQAKQAKSIEAGTRLGRLTPKEARKLRAEQHEITAIEREMREDGTLNAKELSELFQKLQHAQNHINKLSRNNISTHEIEPSITNTNGVSDS